MLLVVEADGVCYRWRGFGEISTVSIDWELFCSPRLQWLRLGSDVWYESEVAVLSLITQRLTFM